MSTGEPERSGLPLSEWETDGDPDCPQCGGIGWTTRPTTSIKDPLFGESFPCDCLLVKQQEALERTLWRYARLPREAVLDDMAFDKWSPRDHLDNTQRAILAQAVADALAFAEGTLVKDILLLYGPPGTGKSHLLVSIVRHAQKRGVPAMYAGVSDILDEFRSTFRSGGDDSLDKVRARYAAYPILCMDELGVQRDTSFGDEHLDRLIDIRWRRRMPTAFAMNIEMKDVPQRIADRITDSARMADHWFDVMSWRKDRER